ncbi:MAG: cupredoxin domain-containing protein [Candidatus Pacebacteria bacterium]|nr:cupredoxin domain-containing protein [Candidatus Paceibacterota bacterium]
MNKTASIIITIAICIGIGIVFFMEPKNNPEFSNDQPIENVEIKDGIQYVTVYAKGGYSPSVSIAQAGIPTKLIVKTNKTYDCSSALVIKSIGYQKMLPQTGEEIIDLAIPEAGTMQGLCSMGMYNFTVDFI